MKPHHRASLLVGCLGLFVLYLPDGLRVAGSWPTRPLLGAVPALPVSSVAGTPVADLAARPIDLVPLPAPQGPPPPVTLDQLSIERSGDAYAGGQ